MKHTKGKWEVKQADSKTVVVCGNMVIASDLFDENEEPSIEELDANANLIASAPDMLEILNELKPIVDKILYNHREYSYIDGIDFSYLGDNLDKCLAKAEGNEKNK